MPRILTVDEILSAPDLSTREVDVPEWGGSVMVGNFTKAEIDAISKEARDASGELDQERFSMLMFIHGVKAPKFTMAHYDALRQKSATAIARVMRVLTEVAGMTQEASQAAKATFPEGSA